MPPPAPKTDRKTAKTQAATQNRAPQASPAKANAPKRTPAETARKPRSAAPRAGIVDAPQVPTGSGTAVDEQAAVIARAPFETDIRDDLGHAAADRGPPFMELAAFIARHPHATPATDMRVCIVTNEMVAFHKNGGIGTATSGLIESFAGQGVKLSIIYTARLDLNAAFVRDAISAIRRRGIEFTSLQEAIPADWMNSPRKMSYAIYWLLRRAEPAIIHFNDYLGNGYYTAQARHTGTALRDSVVITTVHGPTRWALSIDERPMSSSDQQEVCFLEERTLEFSDVVLGVSHHLLHWLREAGVRLPRHSYVHKNIMPVLGDARLPRRLAKGQLSEVVFFARQDVRKGFAIMLQAIKVLSETLPQLKFTFLGKFSQISGEHSGALALDELRTVPNMIDFRHNLDRDGALRYLRSHGVLAVIPSMDENSPCTVFECIVEGIPFISSSVGGIPELVALEDHDAILFAPNAKALAAKLQDVVQSGLGEVGLGFDPPTIATQMMGGFAALRDEIRRERREREAALQDSNPLVSVIITHFNRHDLLRKLLHTLQEQTYSNFEVVLVDDGSTNEASVAYIDSLAQAKFSYELTVVRTKNCYLGAARNTGVRRARGEFVKFQDDDNIPFPHEIAHFVRAALYADADIVTGMSRFFRTEAEAAEPLDLATFQYFPLGASLPLGLLHNEYGDANALVRRASFLEDGGFTEIYGVGSEDYEYFLKSESLGRKVVFVPEPLFNYRVGDGSMLQSTSAYRGAKRARAGLRPSSQRWLTELIDFAHETNLAREIKHLSWWRAGKRQFADLHRQMMEGDPDSPQNISRFLDLAARYGRLEDVSHMVTSQNNLFDGANWLEGNARRLGEATPAVRSFLKAQPRILQFESFKDIDLLAPTENLPVGWSIWRMEPTGMLVHPLEGQVTKVIVRQALPPATKIVTVKFSHRNTLGGKVRMGFNVLSGEDTLGESGWVEVLPGSEAYGRAELHAPIAETTDLLLLSEIEGKQDYAWAFADHVKIELAG